MKNLIMIFLLISTTFSCGEIDLDSEKKTSLNYQQLPRELKEIYSTKFDSESDTTHYLVYSLDNKYKLSHYWTGMQKQILLKGFNHHFVINDKKFKLSANQGDPFVLRNKKLYYTTELNLADYNFEKAEYIVIDLRKYLDE